MTLFYRCSSLLSVLCLFSFCLGCFAQERVRIVIGTAHNQFRVIDSYPEYWVDGKPFFEHAAAFFYHRIPRDRWAEELLRLKEMGINTVDLYPFWNWHEPEEGQLDFDGHTNPRRDLKFLLRLIDSLGLKITIRPGPYFTGEWRNGGYPDWLLRRPEYGMSEQSILEGRYPRLSALQRDKSDEAAKEWLKNETHLRYTRKWYGDVLALLKPLPTDRAGPLINIQIDDDQVSFLYNYNGPNTWKYLDLLRQFAKDATDQARLPYYLNGYDMRVNAEANDVTPEPFWNTGQNYQSGEKNGILTASEAATTKFLLEILKTQPLFVPGHIEFQAGWYLANSDTYTPRSDASNTLIATRVMFQNGLKILNYYPISDSLSPAGYDFPSANHFYSWEAAVNYAGKETGRAVYVRRNGRLLAGMGPLLAASHLLSDAGLIYPMATFPQAPLTPAETAYVARFAEQVLWSGVYAHFNFELVDSDHAPAEDFERYRVLLLPNLVRTQEELKRYPHLGNYSEKAQRMANDYVTAGGTLIVFPSLPRGKIFDLLLGPLGTDRVVDGDSPLKFADGSTALALGCHAILTLPGPHEAGVKVFARDARGAVVGARFTHGQGQVIFFGADFSRWSVPPTRTPESPEGGEPSAKDYSEATQNAARLVLPELMKEARSVPKVYPKMQTRKGRDPGLYVSELISDEGSLAFEKRADGNSGFGFVGVTNFSAASPRTAEIVLTNPRLRDLASLIPEGYLQLPALTVPPRESLMLPVRVPLSTAYGEMAPGLEATDEVYYATSELTRVAYDGATIRLEFTAPTDGEVALRLSRRPLSAKLDGQNTALQNDRERHLDIVKISKGTAPHFIRVVELAYPHQGPHLTFHTREPWIVGETRVVSILVENTTSMLLAGQLGFAAGEFYYKTHPPLAISVPGHATREFSLPVKIPAEAVANQAVELVATLRSQGSTWTWQTRVVVRRPFDYALSPVEYFPLREDQRIPIVHPTLLSLDLPGEATLSVRVKNWQDHEQAVALTAEGAHLQFNLPESRMVLPASGEATAVIHVAPPGTSGVYRFQVGLRSGDNQANEGVVLAAIRKGEALAYTLDYDRDGFDDIILENQQVRLLVSPDAGGRSFAFVRKQTYSNAFDSVGGMRDNFSTRFEPEDQKGLPDWTRANWLGLYNRPYAFQIVSAAGPQAEARLEYFAPDIYPHGVQLKRTLKLAGDQNAVIAETALTPLGIGKPQAYVLETSVPFKSFNEPNHSQWFARGRLPGEFVPNRQVDLEGAQSFVGTTRSKTGETFALLSLTPAARTQMVVENHSALIRVIYPPFAEKRTYRYIAAYYFGKATPREIERLFAQLKSTTNF